VLFGAHGGGGKTAWSVFAPKKYLHQKTGKSIPKTQIGHKICPIKEPLLNLLAL